MKSVQEMSMDLKMEQWWVIFDVGGVLVNDAFPDCFHPLLASYPTEQRDQLLSIHRRNYDLWKRYRSDPQYKEEDYWADVVSRGMSLDICQFLFTSLSTLLSQLVQSS